MYYMLKKAIFTLRRHVRKIVSFYKRGILPTSIHLKNLKRGIERLESLLTRTLAKELSPEKAKRLAKILTFTYYLILELASGKFVKGTFVIRIDYDKKKLALKTRIEPVYAIQAKSNVKEYKVELP